MRCGCKITNDTVSNNNDRHTNYCGLTNFDAPNRRTEIHIHQPYLLPRCVSTKKKKFYCRKVDHNMAASRIVIRDGGISERK